MVACIKKADIGEWQLFRHKDDEWQSIRQVHQLTNGVTIRQVDSPMVPLLCSSSWLRNAGVTAPNGADDVTIRQV